MFFLQHRHLPAATSGVFLGWETKTKVTEVNLGSKALWLHLLVAAEWREVN